MLIRARFRTRCVNCNGWINPGSMIDVVKGKPAVHEGCIKPDLRIEYPARGATYCHNEFGVYEYAYYEEWSVLASQEKRTFRGSFPTLAEAQAAFPDATTAACGYREFSLPRVAPDWFDPLAAGERWDEED